MEKRNEAEDATSPGRDDIRDRRHAGDGLRTNSGTTDRRAERRGGSAGGTGTAFEVQLVCAG